MDEVGQKPAVWKHIGLYGHAVGTFTGKRNNNITRVPPESCLGYFMSHFFLPIYFICTHDMCYLFVIGQLNVLTTRSPPRPYK